MRSYVEMFLLPEDLHPYTDLSSLMLAKSEYSDVVRDHIRKSLKVQPSKDDAVNWVFLMLYQRNAIGNENTVEDALVVKTLQILQYTDDRNVLFADLNNIIPAYVNFTNIKQFKDNIIALLQLRDKVTISSLHNPLDIDINVLDIAKEMSADELQRVDIAFISAEQIQKIHEHYLSTGEIYGVDYLNSNKDFIHMERFVYAGDITHFYISSSAGISYLIGEDKVPIKVNTKVFELQNCGITITLDKNSYIDFQLIGKSFVVFAASGVITIESAKELLITRPASFNQTTKLIFQNTKVLIPDYESIEHLVEFNNCSIESDIDTGFTCAAEDIVNVVPKCMLNLCNAKDDAGIVRELVYLLPVDITKF